MRKLTSLFIIILSGLFIYGCSEGEGNKEPTLKAKEVKSIIPQKEYALLIVESKSCIYCKQMRKDMREDQKLKEAIKSVDVFFILYEDLSLVKTNINGKEKLISQRELAQTLNALSFPYLIFLNKKGEIVLRIPGYIEPQTMVCVIDYVNEGAYQQYKVEEYIKMKNCA